MKEKLDSIRENTLAKIAEAKDAAMVNEIKVAILGKKGELTQVLKGMKDVAPEDRPKVGQMVNDARQAIEARNHRCNPSGSKENRRSQTSEPDSS
jgi:phenylalanyl-tRNA synthetase alpha chain